MGLDRTGYYTTKDIRKKKAQYNVVLGERAPGKSYAVKRDVLKRAFKEEKPTFIIIRRYEEDVKNSYIQNYFADNNTTEGNSGEVFTITGGEYEMVYVYQSKIYFANRDPESGKIVPGMHIGYTMALSSDERYKSQQFPTVTDVIFEEFVTRKLYLKDECIRLMNLISTIARKREVSVWMIANSISRVCPYFTDWGLRNIPRMKEGTIDCYIIEDTKIAVEMCPSKKQKTKMFFGQAAKSIQGGQWETDLLPALPGDYDEYEKLYELYLEGEGFIFKLELLMDEDAECVLYVYPFTKTVKPELPIITDEFSVSQIQRPYLKKTIAPERKISELFQQGKVCFASNLCGTDFYSVHRNMKGGLIAR